MLKYSYSNPDIEKWRISTNFIGKKLNLKKRGSLVNLFSSSIEEVDDTIYKPITHRINYVD